MQKIEQNRHVDLLAESAAVAAFIRSRWTGVTDAEGPAAICRLAAARDARYGFLRDTVALYLLDRVKARHALLESLLGTSAGCAKVHDAVCEKLTDLSFAADAAWAAGQRFAPQGCFEQRCTPVLDSVRAHWPDIDDAKPMGYDALHQGYSDFDGMAAYCETQQAQDEADFRGTDSSSARTPSLPSRIALPYVLYDDVCQGRRAPYVLVSSVYAHFLRLVEHNNTQDILMVLAEEPIGDDVKGLVFVPPRLTCAHPILAAMASVLPQRLSAQERYAAFSACLDVQAEHHRMSPAEREAQRARAALNALRVIDELLAEEPQARAAQDEQKVAKACAALARAAALTAQG